MGRNIVLNFDFELNNDALGIYGEIGRATLYKNAGEGFPHIAMKLLSYFLFYHPDLAIEKHAGQHWKPDLVRLDDQLEPIQWVDCGATKRHKLDRISVKNKKTHIDIVKKSLTELRSYKEMVERTLRQPDRVRYWTFDSDFLEAFCKKIFGRHKIIATIVGDYEQLYLSIDDLVLETPIFNL